MDLNSIPLFEAMADRMTWLGSRQKVLAENIANADTPGYIAKDLKAPSFRDALLAHAGPLSLAVTEPGHISGNHRPVADASVVADRNAERSPSGNGVSLEDQMIKVSQTASDYQMATNLYRRQLGMIHTAIGRSS
jgi:flagellar basal-body rod protein FlgB